MVVVINSVSNAGVYYYNGRCKQQCVQCWCVGSTDQDQRVPFEHAVSEQTYQVQDSSGHEGRSGPGTKHTRILFIRRTVYTLLMKCVVHCL